MLRYDDSSADRPGGQPPLNDSPDSEADLDPDYRGRLRVVLITLCFTEITSWGVLYYAFPVLAPSIAQSTGWSVSSLVAAFSVGQVVAAVTGIPVGRVLDRVGPRQVMSWGSVLAVVSLGIIATADNLMIFFGGWVVAGVAMGGVLYAPAFAALTRWYGPRRVQALTVLTLAAGLASTVFAPLTAVFANFLDWRATYGWLALILAVITVPGHVWGLRLAWHPSTDDQRAEGEQVADPSHTARSRSFILLVVSMSLAAFAVYAVVVNLVPLLTSRGLSTSTAAIALGLGGVGQVIGRMGFALLVRRTTVRTRTALILLTAAATTAILGLIPGPAILLVIASTLAGAARGVFTLLQATAIPDRWGTLHYGRLNGLLGAPVTLAAAVAPWAGTALAGVLGGYPAVFVFLACVAVVAAALATASAPKRTDRHISADARVE